MIYRIIISGPSGVGKDSLIQDFLKLHPEARLSVSVTTRDPRPSEVHGRDYFFTDKETFTQMIHRGELAEYTVYQDEFYGTPNYDEETGKDSIVIYNVEPEGNRNLSRIYPSAVSVLLGAPAAVVADRMVRRDGVINEKRMQSAGAILRQANDYDFFLCNDCSREEAVRQLELILAVMKLRTDSQKDTIDQIIGSFCEYV